MNSNSSKLRTSTRGRGGRGGRSRSNSISKRKKSKLKSSSSSNKRRQSTLLLQEQKKKKNDVDEKDKPQSHLGSMDDIDQDEHDHDGGNKNSNSASSSNAPIQQIIENLTIQISVKEELRSKERTKMESLFDQLQKIRREMKSTEEGLQVLDDEIAQLEKERKRTMNSSNNSNGEEVDCATQYPMSLTQAAEEEQFSSVSKVMEQKHSRNDHNTNTRVTDESSTTSPQPQPLEDEEALAIADYYDDNDDYPAEEYFPEEEEQESGKQTPEQQQQQHNNSEFVPTLSCSAAGNNNNNENVHRAALPAGLLPTSLTAYGYGEQPSSSSTSTKKQKNGSKIDSYFSKNTTATTTGATASSSTTTTPRDEIDLIHCTNPSLTTTSTSTAAASTSIFPPSLQLRYNVQSRSQSNRSQSNGNDYPWSNHLMESLQNTFKIRNFRDNQKEIINATMSGQDVFVIMRTGGGKSLTYQLPALLEGRSPARKITLVVSPLLSLIRDQEDQMNGFCPGSSLAFTSGLAGGTTEHTRRWNLARDPNSGICIIFVTPEKVHKSNKLRSELEKLNKQGRLGRFVIDECHCACQWGHDFRPDYTKLGILKQHFPQVPLIAVTATASDRIRQDCCQILNISPTHRFFRSSADRPNLKYSIRAKPEGADKVVTDMATFIQEKHPQHAGIIYTFSRKEADTVAIKLNDHGISARAYHSNVSDSAKESIHRSWMRNKTQVVVATIAFGLGINKPDVRFVLHHTLSKSLEAYYQESGRAGRDGGPADCVLYYAVRDISRMIGMIHGENGEGAFWSMVRYGQQNGDDALCRRIILSTLGEPGCARIEDVLTQEGSSSPMTEEREVGKHAKTLIRLLQEVQKEQTLAQIVSQWRSKGAETPDFLLENPPQPDLTKDECDRLVAALLLSDVLYPNVVFTSYNSIVYIGLKEKAAEILSHPNPKVRVRFPIREVATTKSRKSTNTNSNQNENGWISKNSAKKTKRKIKKTAKQKECNSAGISKNGTSSQNSIVIIDSDDEPLVQRKPTSLSSTRKPAKRQKNSTDDIFDDSSSENEFE